MNGNAQKIHDLWLEMTGQKGEESLDHIWAVFFGSRTEEANLDWFQRRYGLVTRRGEVVVHYTNEWAAATLDGWHDEKSCPIECKTVGGRESLETIIERYQPQMQWQMIVTDSEECALSVIMGGSEPIVEYIPRDDEYGKELFLRAFQFITHVRNRTPPVALPPVMPPILPTRTVDMTGNNQWADSAYRWLLNRRSAEAAEMAKQELKALVSADTKNAHGHGVQVLVNRAGSKTIKELTP
jgi:predicted phage-related endonuclease